MSCPFRVGIGYDIHPFAEGRPLILGGVTIPFPMGLSGHSDADVLCHATIDALLGAMAWPNIGQRYPDSDPHYTDISSTLLLKDTLENLRGHLWEIANIDTILIAQQPKISPFIGAIRDQLAKILRIPAGNIGIKATTHEHLDAIGEGRAIACHASCLLYRRDT
ncbi:MAG: 2-C-methyl-D-erythritol 2,4-cyclodiphosphate synthase [Puniceicoccales bacterium]|jgi:2-C-methyl-D-erythritol 2,4-cyclodiphosphate synthase|nr:2-C-methyl-D-erythritol 2,4-cyclodiphosphate synthase [Puniceicoccales bacterium]